MKKIYLIGLVLLTGYGTIMSDLNLTAAGPYMGVRTDWELRFTAKESPRSEFDEHL